MLVFLLADNNKKHLLDNQVFLSVIRKNDIQIPYSNDDDYDDAILL